jgi:hypothetical protein
VDRDEAQSWFVELLLDKVRQDHYPSVVHLDMIEEVIRPEMVGDYLQVLMDRCADDSWPSVTLLRRIQRVAADLPAASSQAASTQAES